jgi:homoserine dehydrogenase
MGNESVKIGLIGLGTIGAGVVELFKQNGSKISEQIDLNLILEKVADRDLSRAQGFELADGVMTAEASEVIDNPEIDIVIELIGGINPARDFITRALENGKYVVTANKDLMATYGRELFALARKHNRNIFYEASVGGGIPLIRPLKQSLVADRLHRIIGIVNGTTNYIFTRMTTDNLDLKEALAEAQKLGFAEPDPTNDIEGRDAVYKLVIMAGLAFGQSIAPDQVYVQGISGVTFQDITYARELGYAIKLLAIGEKLPSGIALRVHPALVSHEHPLASVRNEFNAIFIEGEAVGDVMLYGRGAGAKPTATAILADVAEAARSIRQQTNGGVVEKIAVQSATVPITELYSRFYLRILADDRPGVFASLGNAFGDEQVSLDMVIQKRRVGGLAEIVLVTHDVKEDAFQNAFSKVMQIPAVKPEPSMIRLLG